MKEEFIGELMFSINKNLKLEVEKEFEFLKIGYGQLQLLMKLFEQPDMLFRQSELVESLGIDKSNASRNLKKLHDKGLVEVCQINNRDKGVRLTNLSQNYKLQIFKSLQTISKKMLHDITQEDLKLTHATLLKMKDNLH